MEKLFERFRKNILTQLFTYGFIMAVMGLLSNWFTWTYPVMVVMCIVIAFYVLVFVIAALVNFIKDRL